MHKRFLALDGIRGFAALIVLAYHSILVYDSTLIQRVLNLPIQYIPLAQEKLIKITLVFFNGQAAVTIFFILSGLVLSVALRKSILHHPVLLSIEFALKRIARIYPTLIVSLTIFWATFVLLHQLNPNFFSAQGPRNLVYNALLLKTVINGATWTLQIEILAIPFILFCFFIQKKFGVKALLLILLYLLLSLDNAFLQIPIIPTILYQNFPAFICGFLIASESAEQFFILIVKDSRLFMLALLGLVIVPLISHSLSFSSLLIQLFFASIVLSGIYYRQFTPLLKMLESRPSVYLGKISYSFYLNNVIFLYIFQPIFAVYFPTKDHPLEFGLLTAAICAVFGIVLSHITQKYVEQPSIKFGKVITNFFSAIETKYLAPPVLKVGISTNEDSQTILPENIELPIENIQS